MTCGDNMEVVLCNLVAIRIVSTDRDAGVAIYHTYMLLTNIIVS